MKITTTTRLFGPKSFSFTQPSWLHFLDLTSTLLLYWHWPTSTPNFLTSLMFTGGRQRFSYYNSTCTPIWCKPTFLILHGGKFRPNGKPIFVTPSHVKVAPPAILLITLAKISSTKNNLYLQYGIQTLLYSITWLSMNRIPNALVAWGVTNVIYEWKKTTKGANAKNALRF